MGKVDAALECYLEDPERYADLLNAYWFQGRQIVKPEQVTEKDTRLSGRSRRRRAKKRRKMSQTGAHQKQRDAIRKIVFGAGVTVIALENQTHVHLAMPVRTFVEDALEYDKQLRAIQRGHRKTRDLKEKEEVLSGFSSIDRILPTSTLVLYWGEKKMERSP